MFLAPEATLFTVYANVLPRQVLRVELEFVESMSPLIRRTIVALENTFIKLRQVTNPGPRQSGRSARASHRNRPRTLD